MESTRISPNEVLKDAYYKHISLSNTVKRKTADFIRFLNNIFIPLMKKRDILFDFLFQQVYLEGSYIIAIAALLILFTYTISIFSLNDVEFR